MDGPCYLPAGAIGITAGASEMEIIKEPFLKAAASSFDRTNFRLTQIAVQTYTVLFGAIRKGDVQTLKQNTGGPLAIFHIASEMSQRGLSEFIEFLIT